MAHSNLPFFLSKKENKIEANTQPPDEDKYFLELTATQRTLSQFEIPSRTYVIHCLSLILHILSFYYSFRTSIDALVLLPPRPAILLKHLRNERRLDFVYRIPRISSSSFVDRCKVSASVGKKPLRIFLMACFCLKFLFLLRT